MTSPDRVGEGYAKVTWGGGVGGVAKVTHRFLVKKYENFSQHDFNEVHIFGSIKLKIHYSRASCPCTHDFHLMYNNFFLHRMYMVLFFKLLRKKYLKK